MGEGGWEEVGGGGSRWVGVDSLTLGSGLGIGEPDLVGGGEWESTALRLKIRWLPILVNHLLYILIFSNDHVATNTRRIFTSSFSPSLSSKFCKKMICS